MVKLRGMKKAAIIVVVTIFLLMGILGILRLLVGGGEDTWICVNGQWVKHGAPRAPMPESGCEK